MLNNNQIAVDTYWQRTFRPDSLCVSVSPPGIWHPHPQGRIPFLVRSRPSWVWTAEASVCFHLEDKKKSVTATDMIIASGLRNTFLFRWWFLPTSWWCTLISHSKPSLNCDDRWPTLSSLFWVPSAISHHVATAWIVWFGLQTKWFG